MEKDDVILDEREFGQPIYREGRKPKPWSPKAFDKLDRQIKKAQAEGGDENESRDDDVDDY